MEGVLVKSLWGDCVGRTSPTNLCVRSVLCLKHIVSTSSKMVSLIESTTLPVTAFYAGILSIIFAGLALRVGLTRASNGVMHGDGGKQDMVRKARAQGNLAEYLPVFLILLGLLELNKGLSSYFLHLIGTAFTVARVGHAAQLSLPDSVPKQCREFGFLATAGILAFLGVCNLYGYCSTPKY